MSTRSNAAAPQQRRRGRPPKGTRGDTRQDLLDAALRLFARQGYAATTVRQIADEVGVRDSAIYAHFSAKQELLDALVAESGPQLVDSLQFDFAGMAMRHPADVLPDLFRRLIREWDTSRNRQLISLLTREGFAGAAEGLAIVRERLREPFQQWLAGGILRRDASPELLLWELTFPLAAVRILHLNTQATSRERVRGRKLAEDHVAYFLATAIT